MKDAVWLACCPRNERRIVQREIESREMGARLLWLDGVQALGEVLAALSEPVDGVVVLDDEGMATWPCVYPGSITSLYFIRPELA